MTRLSYRQVAGVCYIVGVPAHRVPVMTAICMGESGRRTDAIGPTNDWGLWQINRRVWGPLFKKWDWWKPIDNGRMMKHILDRQGLQAWTIYNNGAYRKYMAQAIAAASFPDKNIPGGSQPEGGNDPVPGKLYPPPGAGADDYSAWVNATRGQFNNIFRLANTRATQLNRIRWRMRK